jgi:RNA polymerase sigma factor (sigma-70 family)
MSQKGASDADRFLALLRPIQRELEIYCRRLVWESQEAPDTMQNAVMRGFAAFERYDPQASFRAWMFKILTREAFAMNRKHAGIARHEFQLEPEELAALSPAAEPGPQPDWPALSQAWDDALEGRLAAGLKMLTEHERAVLLLRSIGELRYREIGESLGIPLGSVMGHLWRARQKMRAFLGRSAPRNNSLKENEL